MTIPHSILLLSVIPPKLHLPFDQSTVVRSPVLQTINWPEYIFCLPSIYEIDDDSDLPWSTQQALKPRTSTTLLSIIDASSKIVIAPVPGTLQNTVRNTGIMYHIPKISADANIERCYLNCSTLAQTLPYSSFYWWSYISSQSAQYPQGATCHRWAFEELPAVWCLMLIVMIRRL